MTAPRSGRNGLIYISGTELSGANAWSIKIDQDKSEAPVFGDDWKRQIPGHLGYSGSVNAWDYPNGKLLADAAMANEALPFLIYPVRTELGDYYSGNAIFGMSSSGNATSAISKDGDFVGDGTLTVTGFTT